MNRALRHLCAAIAICVAFVAGNAAAAPTLNVPAQDFSLITLDGKELKLADLKGQVVVVNFWATWCGPCKQELPLLAEYSKAAKPYGLRVFAVLTQDTVKPEELKPFAEKLDVEFVREFRGPYGPLRGVPTNYVIDRAGILRYAEAGSFEFDRLNALLVPLLDDRHRPDPEGESAQRIAFPLRP